MLTYINFKPVKRAIPETAFAQLDGVLHTAPTKAACRLLRELGFLSFMSVKPNHQITLTTLNLFV